MSALNPILHALADPTRRAILLKLAEGETTPSELARPFSISAPAISRHLRVLEDAGLIRRRVDAQRRPCALEPAALTHVEEWLATLREALEHNYARLDRLLAEQQEGEAT